MQMHEKSATATLEMAQNGALDAVCYASQSLVTYHAVRSTQTGQILQPSGTFSAVDI